MTSKTYHLTFPHNINMPVNKKIKNKGVQVFFASVFRAYLAAFGVYLKADDSKKEMH